MQKGPLTQLETNARSFDVKFIPKTHAKDRVPEYLIYACTAATVLIVLTVFYYIFSEALPVFREQGINFLIGTTWNYQAGQYGILYFIMSSLILTAVTLCLACPVSLLTAIFLTEFAPPWMSGILRPMIELLVGIPSVVYGFLGGFVLRDFFKTTLKPFIGSTLGGLPIFANVFPQTGDSILLASTVLAIMIVPTVTVLTMESIRSVPLEYRHASIALGATKWETIKNVIVPVSMSGIITAVLLGMMRAMGETMAVVMLTSNNLHMPTSVLDSCYAMTSKILNDIVYYYPDDRARSAIMGIAAALFIIEIGLLILAKAIGARLK